MKLRVTITLLAIISFSGCTSPSSLLTAPKIEHESKAHHYTNYNNAPNHKLKAFSKAQHSVGLSTKKDPNYKSFRPILTTDERRYWFNNNMYLLWDRQITRAQYVSKSTSKFPAYKYEFTFIANQF
ncbi:MAG: hypothetical protein Q9M39_06980 [Sulfurovum sp.]|nr:hypothetical protein [Sulfurovum sp.]